MKFQPRLHENGDICCAAYNDLGEPIPSPSQCPKCDEHFAALQGQDDDIPHAPDPYESGLKKLRTAHATAESTFAADYRQRGLRDLQAMRDKLDAEQPERAPRLTAAELSQYAPPDPYAAGLKALREREKR
jgi:hypothetical protein